MKDFLNKLYDTNSQLSLLIIKAKEYAEQYNDNDLVEFLEREINGYKIENGLPDYRIIPATIVCDIKDVYGQIQYKEYPVDFSLLSEKVGLKLDNSYIPDSISFIEMSLKNISKHEALRLIPNEVVKMLNEAFHYNNNHLNIYKAYHKVPTANLEYIIMKTRQILIQKFQKLSKELEKKSEQVLDKKVNNKSTLVPERKKIFVTYAWEDEENNELVMSFVEFLRKTGGFDAFMDRKITQEKNATNLNQMMIESIQNSEKVIVILSKKYKEKANRFEGGVGTEFKIIIEDMKLNPNKYIFVYFGKESREKVTPTALLGYDILNLKEDQDKNKFNTLFSKIKEENIIVFSEVKNEEIQIKKIDIKPFEL